MTMAKNESTVTPVDIVPVKIASATLDAFKRAYDQYWQEGGISDLKAKLETLSTGDTSIGGLLLNVGRMCLEHAGEDHKAAAAIFAGACKQTETKVRDDDKDTRKLEKLDTMQKILPTWGPSKANVMAALNKGLALNSKDDKGNLMYPGIGSVRAAVAKQRGTQNRT